MPFGVFIVIIYVSRPKAGSIIFVYCPNRLHRRQPTVIDNAQRKRKRKRKPLNTIR